MKEGSEHNKEDGQEAYRNKFELVTVAAKRARQLREGRKRLIEVVSDKEPVIALAEILSGRLKAEIIRRNSGHSAGS